MDADKKGKDKKGKDKKGKGDKIEKKTGKDKAGKKRKKDEADHEPLPDGGSDDDDNEDENFGLEGLQELLKDSDAAKKKPASNQVQKRPAKRDGKKHEEAPSKFPSSFYIICVLHLRSCFLHA